MSATGGSPNYCDTGKTTRFNQEALQSIPSARDPWVILEQTPGVAVDRQNVGGSLSGQQSNFVRSTGRVNVTVTPGSTPPDVSVTLPKISPVCCADETAGPRINANETGSGYTGFRSTMQEGELRTPRNCVCRIPGSAAQTKRAGPEARPLLSPISYLLLLECRPEPEPDDPRRKQRADLVRVARVLTAADRQ
jgi:hypothetical protein